MKNAKKLLAALISALSISVMTLSANVVYGERDLTNYNDNGIYEHTVSKWTKIPYEEEFVEYLNDLTKEYYGDEWENVWHTIHVYKGENGYKFERVKGISRTFATVLLHFGDDWSNLCFSNDEELMEKYSLEEMNNFLVENGYKAHLEMRSTKNGYILRYDDNSDENKFKTFLALYKRFGAKLSAEELVESEICLIIPDLSLTSAVKFQRYLSHSAELDNSELTDFDLNGDGDLNVIDLIMMKRKLTDMNK